MKNTKLIIGVGFVVILLAGVAFLAGQLLQTQQKVQAQNNAANVPRKLVTPAAGVPTTQPDARGNVTHRDGNSIFICEPNDTITINPDGTINDNGGCGPEFEVILQHDTLLLHDITARQYAQATMPAPGQNMVLQQAVEPGSANDISEGTVLRVWGQINGSRIVARTILYWNRPAPR